MSRLTQIAISVALVSLVHCTSGLAQTPPRARSQTQLQTPAPTQNLAQSQGPTPTQTPVPAPIQAQIPTSGGTQQPDTVPTSELKSAPPTPIAEKKAELGDNHTWNPEWDKIIEEGLPPDLLSPKVAKAVKQFCPHFNRMGEPDKRAYWAYFFQALAGAETSLVSTTDVRHDDSQLAVVDDVTHRKVRQQGLLQLTYMDQTRYGCDFNWEKDRKLEEHDPAKTILQPRNNLLCGVAILKNQLIDQQKPLLSGTSYWSTLQPGTIGVKVFLKQMANVPAACGRLPVHGQQKRIAPARETAAAVPVTPSQSSPDFQTGDPH
jgi:hypothetical protein